MTEQIAVITGASQGAGKAIAERLAKGGVRLILVGRTADKLRNVVDQIGSGAASYTLDVTQSRFVTELAEAISNQFGHIDMLINCAGEAFIAPLEQTEEADWDRILNVNLKGPFLMTRAFLPLLRKSANASIVNIVSKVALGGHEGVSVYTAAKTGLLGFTRSMAAELRKEEIRAVAICPGAMDTPMRWATTPDFDPKLVISANTIAEMVWHVVNLPKGVTTGEILLESVHYES